MKRIVPAAVLACPLAVSAATLSADSRPALAGQVAGIELCPQFICGFALFVGQFEGEPNSRDASGGFAGAITHEPLPAVSGTPALTGGSWTITANRRVIQGDVAGGSIFNIDGTRCCVEMEMAITSGGRGQPFFNGVLDHNPLPPTIGGLVTTTTWGASPSCSPCQADSARSRARCRQAAPPPTKMRDSGRAASAPSEILQETSDSSRGASRAVGPTM